MGTWFWLNIPLVLLSKGGLEQITQMILGRCWPSWAALRSPR